MKKAHLIGLLLLAISGCEHGHIEEDDEKEASTKPSPGQTHPLSYIPNVIRDANTGILNLNGSDVRTYNTENLARVTTFVNDRMLNALGVQNIDELIEVSEQALYNGTRTKKLSNGDIVEFTVYYADASAGKLSLVIEGNSDILSAKAPRLIEHSSNSHKMAIPKGDITFSQVIIIDPSKSKSTFSMEIGEYHNLKIYSFVKDLNEATYTHSAYKNKTMTFQDDLLFNINRNQVQYSINEELIYLFYNSKTDTLSR
ncbi:hypothetical protein [Vibrio atypicus]|uniref:hypothetical protein n=1 Tax=Vibrio atypicus TaxID=558271 RepID=UPI001356C963|nr:hypothetical protein [Vibrio atypicus]